MDSINGEYDEVNVMMNEKQFCINCNKYVQGKVQSRTVKFTYSNSVLSYIEYYCICPVCGEEIYSGIINDVNRLERERLVDEERRTRALLGWSE